MTISILTLHKYFSKERKNGDNPNSNRTIITNHSPFSINEANICHKISKIPYYTSFFSILEDYDDLNISQLHDTFIEKLKPIKDVKYYLFKYNDKHSISFIDYLYEATSIKKLMFDIINSFQHIVEGLCLLNDNNICFFNISPKNIVYLNDYREKPLLHNFRFSINKKKLDFNYIAPILHTLENFTYQPLEIHILYYFAQHNMITISYSFIEEFCEDYVENLSILRLFSDNYKQSYKQHCCEIMRKYINQTKQQIINDILEKNQKWDVYGISVIYLHIFACISRVFSLKSTFINKITMALSRNIHPDSNKRMTLDETLEVFTKLFNEEDNWQVISSMDNAKLAELFDELSK
jgi:hypothetical protein